MNADQKENQISASLLRNLYVDQRLSTWKIGEQLNISRSHALTLLRRNDIEVRTRAEAHRVYARHSFAGSAELRAYMIGFAIGDLRVRKMHKESETISIACSSTHPAQITLITELFSPYGRVWVSTKNERGVVDCEAYVDLSFSFLLKSVRTTNFESDKEFLAFVAGFTDAEGSIFHTNQNKWILSWGQYDEKLLALIKERLEKMGYALSKIYCDNLAGYQGKDGYKRKQDYFHLNCVRKLDLKNLLEVLQPYIRHEEKRAAIAKALASYTL